jgi:antirestriction protein ArdC
MRRAGRQGVDLADGRAGQVGIGALGSAEERGLAVTNIREQIVERIIADLEKGTPPWRKGWTCGGLCINGDSGRPYRGINQIVTGMSGYGDPRWLTFRQAAAKGWHVRKGEKSTKIVRMVEVARSADRRDDEDVVAEGDGRRLVMRAYDVFNASQIEGIEPLAPQGTPVEPVAAADAIMAGMQATGLVLLHGSSGACYVPRLDTIRMPDRSAFHSTEDYYSTLLHEAGHATGAEKRLNRLNPSIRHGSVEYAKEELRAELSAAMLCGQIGLVAQDAHIESHAAYVASWLEVLKKDRNELFRAANAAQQICDYLSERAVRPEVGAEAAGKEPMPVVGYRVAGMKR